VVGILAMVDRWLPGGMAGVRLVAASGMPDVRSAALVRSGVLVEWPLMGRYECRPLSAKNEYQEYYASFEPAIYI